MDDTGIGERRAEADAETVDRALGAGSERKGERWSRPDDGVGGGGPEDDDDDDDKDGASRVDRARSRLERLLEMDSATPPFPGAPLSSDDASENGLFSPRLQDTALGASLKAELEAHLERRRLRLGELRAERSARGARAVPDAAIARVQADVDALVAEIRAFETGGPEYARDASGRVVARAASEIERSRRAGAAEPGGSGSAGAAGGYLEYAGEWREVSRAAAEVTKLDLEMEKLSASAMVTGKPLDAKAMRELRDRRSAWGLRLVAAQIKGVSGTLGDVARLDSNLSSRDQGLVTRERDGLTEVSRLEKLAREKSALLKRLQEKEKDGVEARDAAKKLRAEVLALRQKLAAADARASRSDEDAAAVAALEKKLRVAEQQKFRLKMRAETEASRLYAKVRELTETLAKREAELKAARAELAEADAARRAESETLAAKVKQNEAEIASLKTELSETRAEMAEKDKQFGEATRLLKAQLAETRDALEDSEAKLERARAREAQTAKALEEERRDAASAAADAEARRATAERDAEAARAEASRLAEELETVEFQLSVSERKAKDALEQASSAVAEARAAEAKATEASRDARKRVADVEARLAAKTAALREALESSEKLESSAMEADFAAERAARAELASERLQSRVAELEATETRLEEVSRAA